MKNSLLSKAMIPVAILLLVTAASAQSTDAKSSTPGTSKVRIVRLSQVKGTVGIDRHIGRGFEAAIANLPVVEHSQIRTGVGVAEIEFEDNSSLRLAPGSAVEFLRLEREASGATGSTVQLIQGTAYISMLKQSSKAPANQFQLVFGSRKLNLDPGTHIRLDLKGSQAKLAVLDGAVHVGEENAAVSIPKKKTATFQLFDANEPTVAKDIESSPFDGWDHTSASYHSNTAALSAFSSPYSYGMSDMSYYGNFANSSCGSMWRPYFASAGWDPFSNGTWAYYPGSGYSWVSPYPWAWTPYHSGAWSYCSDMGWGWMPGGDWYGLNNVAAFGPAAGTGLPGGPIRAPHMPVRAPGPNQPLLIAVNTKPLAKSEIASSDSFVFRKDSAGLGVPRGTMGRLDKLSHETVTRGVATTSIFTSIPQTGRPGGSMTMGESMATTIHRGSAPTASTPTETYSPWATGSTSSSSTSSSMSPSVGTMRTTSAPPPVSSGGSTSKK